MRAHCTICSDLFDGDETNPVAAIHGCGHTFHDSCLAEWLDHSETCPQCRKRVTWNGIIHKLYFDQPAVGEYESTLSKLQKEVRSLKISLRLKDLEYDKLGQEVESLNQEMAEMSQEKNNLEKEVAASCSMVSELLDILSEREKQKQKGATQQRGARDALLPTPTVVPGGKREALLPTPTVVPGGTREALLPTPTLVPGGKREALLPTPTVVPGGTREALLPTPTVVPGGTPDALSSTPTVVPGGTRNALLPTPTVVSGGARNALLPTPTVVSGSTRDGLLPTPTIIQGGTGDGLLPTPTVVPGGMPDTLSPGTTVVQDSDEGDCAEFLLPISPSSQRARVAPNIMSSLLEHANKETTLIIADSRGLFLSTNLREDLVAEGINPENVQVAVFEGAGLQDAYNLAQPLIDQVDPDLLIITAGICSITKTTDKKSFLRFSSIEAATKIYYESMDHISAQVENNHPTLKLVFAPLTGIDLTVYNNMTEPHPQQDLLNDAITEINSDIGHINYKNKAFTPWIASIIHKKLDSTRYSHNYDHLSDGYHLSPAAAAYWARQLTKAIERNLAYDRY